MLSELTRRAARSLLDTPLRTALTVSGIAIGIAALFSLLSVAEGIRHRIVDEWLSSGLMTSLSVMPGGSMQQMRGEGPGPHGRRPRPGGPGEAKKPEEARRALDDAVAKEIAAIPGVRRVWPVVTRPVELVAVKAGSAGSPGAASPGGAGSPQGAAPAGSEGAPAPAESAPERVTLRGFDTDFFWNEDYIKIVAGGPLNDAGAKQALVAQDRLEGLGFKDAAAAVGRPLLLRWREPAAEGAEGAVEVPGLPLSIVTRAAEFTIVGVFERKGALFLRNAGIIVPTAAAKGIATFDTELIRSLFEGGKAASGYPGLDVYIAPGADLEAIEKKIKDLGFDTISGAEIVSRIRRSILILQAVLGGLGSIAIAVATLGIVNTLITAVFERMREIGVMKAVGARRRDIRRQFLAEAGLIGLAGGALGVAAGYGADHLLSFIIGRVVRAQGGDNPGLIAHHTLTITLGCLAFSIGLSLLAGTFPAARAARLDPVQTLRYE